MYRTTKEVGVAVLMLLMVAACGGEGHTPEFTSEVEAVARDAIPSSVEAELWRDVPTFRASLIPQDMVEPRVLEPTTESAFVQAVTDGERLAFRIRWRDATKDDLPRVALFADACAVQLPRTLGPDVPAPQMGESGKPVEIAYWSAFWQAAVDGRPHEINSIYPRALIDHYPFQAPPLEEGTPEQAEFETRYAPAEAAGAGMAWPREKPVQDLVAAGPGTLTQAEQTRSDGAGHWEDGEWNVLISRPLPDGLVNGHRGQVAFAVWQGSKDEVGARKMRTVWVPLLRSEGS